MMSRRLAVLALLAVCLSGCALLLGGAPGPWAYKITDPSFAPLPGAKAVYGIRNNYAYQIEMPERWNGDLVMYAHGFAGFGLTLTDTAPPIREHLIAEGYAWAASSYSANGWAVRQGADELRDLQAYFAATVGRPARTYIVGVSMGGNIVTDSLETYPYLYDGALAGCGALVGTELFDYFLSYRLAGEYFVGRPFGEMTTPFLDPGFLLETYPGIVRPRLGQPGGYTDAGRRFDSVQQHLSGGARPFRLEGMRLPFGLGASFYEAGFSARRTGAVNLVPNLQVTTNENVVYQIDPGLGLDAETLNRGIERVKADPAARNPPKPAAYSVPTGNIRVPLLTVHTTGDPFVPIFVEASYRRKVEAAGKGDLLVQRAIRRPGHCEFSEAEEVEAFDDLVKWVRNGVKPRGENLLGSLVDVGREWTKPLRPDDPGGM